MSVLDPTSTDPETAARMLLEDVTAEVVADPYPWYRRLRESDPVLWRPEWQEWVVTRHADAVAVLRDPRTSVDPRNGPAVQRDVTLDPDGPIGQLFSTVLLFMDPPAHTRLRALVSRAFTPRSIQRLRPRIGQLVDTLLDAVCEEGSMDLIADVAFPLPVTVICELLGVPADDRELFRTRTPQLAAVLEGYIAQDKLEAAASAAIEFALYLMPLFDQRRETPRDDLITGLVHAEIDGERLTNQELLTTTILLLGAGHETTMNLIGNGMLALLRNPDQLERLRADPTLVRGAVEELLRYDSPVQLTARNVTEDIEIDGRRAKRGQQLLVMLGAANRDPAAFPHPETLDTGRQDIHHLSFSHGAHYCLGASLARTEAEIALAALIARLPDLRLGVAQPAWRPTRTLRGLTALPLLWG